VSAAPTPTSASCMLVGSSKGRHGSVSIAIGITIGSGCGGGNCSLRATVSGASARLTTSIPIDSPVGYRNARQACSVQRCSSDAVVATEPILDQRIPLRWTPVSATGSVCLGDLCLYVAITPVGDRSSMSGERTFRDAEHVGACHYHRRVLWNADNSITFDACI